MKRLLIDILIVLSVFVMINIVVRIAWAYYIPIRCNYDINNPRVSTLVIGSSMSECSINDSILDNCLNLSEGGLYYSSNYNTLRWVNEYSNQKIDTVICCVGLPSFFSFAKEHETVGHLHHNECYSLITYCDFLCDYAFSLSGLKMLWEHLSLEDITRSRWGGRYLYLDRDKINDKVAYEQIAVVREKYGTHGFTEDVIRAEYYKQVKYLKRISDYCSENNMTFIIYNAPCYHLSEFLDDTGYKNYLLNEFGPNQLIADYCNFFFPDNSYYGDYVHLNHKGASFFSNHIRNYGWELSRLKDYCNITTQQ